MSPPPPLPPLGSFLTPGDGNRLRDLLAFALAVEAARPLAPNGIEGLRREADAALEGYAFRSLHNRVEEIRLAAVQDHLGRLRPPPGFMTLVAANLVALLLLAGGALLAWRHYGPALLGWIGA
ncbi:hypothetical protein [Falsiroseomonas ponticola]|uniref:hypothetical protein n=1 Tax=Falsiroseomonas ponticola TaxID=2786951 RepID=UPI0019348C7C|nr:hypothetical protein [Roseomonas ponticola]